jgi:hypothetical protein
MKPHKVVRTHFGSFWCWDSHGWTRTHFGTPHPGLGSKPPPYSLSLTRLTTSRTRGSHHLPPYSILCDAPRRLHPNGSFSRDFRLGVPKSRPAGLPGLWSLITLWADLGSKCGLKQSCSSRRELSNDMSHVVCSQVFWVDSRLLVVGSQNWHTPGTDSQEFDSRPFFWS